MTSDNVFIGGNMTLAAVGIGAAVMIGLTGFISFAERATPTDGLYGLELSVVEPMLGAFRLTSNARANYHYERMIERLEETRDLPFEIQGEERATLVVPVAENLVHHMRGVMDALEGRSDEHAVMRAIDAVAVLELYESALYLEDESSPSTLSEIADEARMWLDERIRAHRDRYTMPELEEMLVREVDVITTEAQSASPYTLGQVMENLYDILTVLGAGDVLGAYDIVYEIKMDLAKDRLSQALLG